MNASIRYIPHWMMWRLLSIAACICSLVANQVASSTEGSHFPGICLSDYSIKHSMSTSVKCFRSQLPQSNDFYAYEPTEDQELTHPNSAHLCGFCGAKAASSGCSQCRAVRYCSRAHQLLHWKAGHKHTCGSEAETNAEALAAVPLGLFRELELVIEEEEKEEVTQETHAYVSCAV